MTITDELLIQCVFDRHTIIYKEGKGNGSATRCVTYPGKGYSVAIKHTTRDGTVYEEASGHNEVVRCLTVKVSLSQKDVTQCKYRKTSGNKKTPATFHKGTGAES